MAKVKGLTTVGAVANGSVVGVVSRRYGSWVSTGDVYKVGRVANHLTGQRYAYTRFGGRRVVLHPTLSCVPVAAEAGWFRS